MKRYLVLLGVGFSLSSCIQGVQDALVGDDGRSTVDTLTVYVPVPQPPDTIFIPVPCRFHVRWECKPVPPPWR